MSIVENVKRWFGGKKEGKQEVVSAIPQVLVQQKEEKLVYVPETAFLCKDIYRLISNAVTYKRVNNLDPTRYNIVNLPTNFHIEINGLEIQTSYNRHERSCFVQIKDYETGQILAYGDTRRGIRQYGQEFEQKLYQMYGELSKEYLHWVNGEGPISEFISETLEELEGRVNICIGLHEKAKAREKQREEEEKEENWNNIEEKYKRKRA